METIVFKLRFKISNLSTSSGSTSLNSIPLPVQAIHEAFPGSSSRETRNCQSCKEPLRCCRVQAAAAAAAAAATALLCPLPFAPFPPSIEEDEEEGESRQPPVELGRPPVSPLLYDSNQKSELNLSMLANV